MLRYMRYYVVPLLLTFTFVSWLIGGTLLGTLYYIHLPLAILAFVIWLEHSDQPLRDESHDRQ